MADPVEGAGAYVAAAYVVFVTLVVVYLGILGSKIARIERELRGLTRLAERNEQQP